MPLPQRARILYAKQGGPPFEDVLRFAHPERHLPVLTSACQAYASRADCDGSEFASILSGKSDKPRPMASREARILPAESEAPCISDRADGVLEEVMEVAELIPPRHRGAVFKPCIASFRFQRWMLSAGWQLRPKLAEALRSSTRSAEDWLEQPCNGVWDFDLSRKGLRLRTPHCNLCVHGKTWRDSPGRPACKQDVVMVACGATQQACWLRVPGGSECKSMLCAMRNSDEVRNPFAKLRSARLLARRLVRGSPSAA